LTPAIGLMDIMLVFPRMELDLCKYLSDRHAGVPVDLVQSLVSQLLRGLAYMHGVRRKWPRGMCAHSKHL
jgi:hypothetical protein